MMAPLSVWLISAGLEGDTALALHLFRRIGLSPQHPLVVGAARRPPPPSPLWSWGAQRSVSAELRRKGVMLTLLWRGYKASDPDGYR
ncbi:hypothetical protein [Rhizobium rhizogenes]|uniref:Uncharacterized protein n=1 Tax=Agrobacterium tumefaciens str. Kerr 14 TaxID=1183424 RepID=A0A1S7SDE0_AGRTU|nr:hypothetical protein [Rhizobium rhizogenes]NTF97811.1 hypothetical protein [Rhizobium rhizogenes]CUX66992.1 hypothetical protein AGR4C_pb20037 [Agrobacterium tumefaciens str. Kerr 14]